MAEEWPEARESRDYTQPLGDEKISKRPMSELERQCITCGTSEEMARLERCATCGKDFCADCAYRATGRRFCSSDCAREYFYGETDDEDAEPTDD